MKVEVAILGSGFGGSLCALILCQLGYDVLVLDRAAHPRFAIGESSTPVGNMVLRDLAERYDLPRLTPLAQYGTWRAAYPELNVGRKRGFSYFFHTPDQPYVPDAAHSNALLVAASSDDERSDTHWYRADVDAFLAAEMESAGVLLWEHAAVSVLTYEDGWHLTGEHKGNAFSVKADFVLDATGGAGVLPRALDLPLGSASFHTCSRAIYTHLDGVRLWEDLIRAGGGNTADHPYRCDDAALHHVLDGGWIWMLRFADDRVSAGLVLDAHQHPLDPALTPQAEWEHWVRQYPSVAEQFADAQVAPEPGRLQRTGRLQRRFSTAAGSHFALLPHTYGFIDPLHSTGVALTLCAIERLMHAFAESKARLPQSAPLRAYSTTLSHELRLIDELVAACYWTMGSPHAFTASTMLYFAATIAYEQARLHHRGTQVFERAFLCADDPGLRSVIRRALDYLHVLRRQHRVLPEHEANVYADFVEQLIAPYNTVGLFHPEVPNMYHHTAAMV